MSIWIAAFNIHSRQWSTGGKASEYERPHWDLYQVSATTRSEAQQEARALRRKQQQLTAPQVALLMSLRQACDAPDGQSIQVSAAEVRSAAALAAKGFVHQIDARHVMLTVSAWNRLACEVQPANREAAHAHPIAEVALKRKGRKPSTGRYATREELCSFVWFDYRRPGRRVSDTARTARVSEAVVHSILNRREGMPAQDSHEPVP